MKLGLVGDMTKATGFATVNEALMPLLARHGWQITALALNYYGDPHPLAQRFRLYPASGGGADPHGFRRIAAWVREERPDVVLIVNDPWVIRRYLHELEAVPGPERPPVVAYTPIDGVGLHPRDAAALDSCAHVIAYTHHGLRELRAAGMTAAASVIPHGVDIDSFAPMDRDEARAALGLPPEALVVLVADRNQMRKRLDLAWAAFAELHRTHPHARLIYHGAPAEPEGYDCDLLTFREGLQGVVGYTRAGATDPGEGLDRAELRAIYAAADVKLSTAMGEGWGLTSMEAMACGTACVAVEWAAIPEWAEGAVALVPTAGRYVYPRFHHTGGVADPAQVAEVLRLLADNPAARSGVAQAGLARVREVRFRWGCIAQLFDQTLRGVVERALTYRPETGDWHIAEAVLHKEEYPLPHQFAPTDVVMDVGAHIGSFSLACLRRGAGRVLAYEADGENAGICARHLEPYSGTTATVTVLHAAVWRSDVVVDELPHSGYTEDDGLINTGGGSVLTGEGTLVPSLAFDDELAAVGAVRLLKLDCEGSEFPILATSRRLHQVAAIVGEIHEFGGPYDTDAPPLDLPGWEGPWTAEALAALLERRGFVVSWARTDDREGRPSRLARFVAVQEGAHAVGE